MFLASSRKMDLYPSNTIDCPLFLLLPTGQVAQSQAALGLGWTVTDGLGSGQWPVAVVQQEDQGDKCVTCLDGDNLIASLCLVGTQQNQSFPHNGQTGGLRTVPLSVHWSTGN